MPRDPRKDLSAIDPQKPATARFWTSPNGCSTRRLIGGPRMTKRLVALAALLAAGEEPFQAAKALGYRRKAARYLCGSEQFEQAYRQAGGAGDLTKLAYEHLVPSAHRRSAAQEPARLDRAASAALSSPKAASAPPSPVVPLRIATPPAPPPPSDAIMPPPERWPAPAGYTSPGSVLREVAPPPPEPVWTIRDDAPGFRFASAIGRSPAATEFR